MHDETMPSPHTITTLNNRVTIIWTSNPDSHQEHRTGIVRAGMPLPRGTHPSAIMTSDGAITRLTSDPLPDKVALANALVQLTDQHTLGVAALGDQVGPGSTLVIDCSGSARENEDLLNQVASTVHDAGGSVLLSVMGELRPYTGVPFRGWGPFDPNTVVNAIEADPELTGPVFIVTDGICPPAHPADPSRWTWVLTPPADMLRIAPAPGTGAIWHLT